MPQDLLRQTWSKGPGAVYGPHSHPYHKTLTCDKGSIEFVLHGKQHRTVQLQAGEKIELPAGTVVGPEGVTCTEVHHLGEK